MAETCGTPLDCNDIQKGAEAIRLGTIVRLPDGENGEIRTAIRVSTVCGTGGGGDGITALTGDVTASGSGSVPATIAANAVTNAKAADMAQTTLKGRAAGAGSGDPTDLTADEASAVLDTATDAFVRTGASNTAISAAVATEAGLRASGDTGTLSSAQTYADGKVAITITNGVTTSAPSQDTVFDALALKSNQTDLDASDADIADLVALTGMPVNSTNLDVFTGSTIPDDSTVKAALQAVETAFEAAVAMAAAPLTRTGSAIAFDARAIYNTPDTPTSGAITIDLSGAVENTQVLCFCNHAVEPTWPAGVTAVGHWNNSQRNDVTFSYTLDGIGVTIVSSATVNYTSNVQTRRITGGSDIVTTSTTPAVITGLTWTGTANHTYLVRAFLRVSGTATSGVNVGFQGAAAITVNGNYTGPSSGVTAFITGPGNIDGTPATADFSEFAATTNSYIDGFATIVIGGSDTVVNMIVASETAGQNSTIYVVNSAIMIFDHG